MRIVLSAALIAASMLTGACIVHTHDGPPEEAHQVDHPRRHKRIKAHRKHHRRAHKRKVGRHKASPLAKRPGIVKVVPKRPAPGIVKVTPPLAKPVRIPARAGGKVVAADSAELATITPPASVDARASGSDKMAPGNSVADAAASGSVGSAPIGERNWVNLGQRQVRFRVDHDTIPVTIRDGRFRAIRIHAKGSSLEMFKVRVSFANGSSFTPRMRHVFKQGAWTRRIDLPGDRRIIKKVDFWYRSLGKRSGKATIKLFGMR